MRRRLPGRTLGKRASTYLRPGKIFPGRIFIRQHSRYRHLPGQMPPEPSFPLSFCRNGRTHDGRMYDGTVFHIAPQEPYPHVALGRLFPPVRATVWKVRTCSIRSAPARLPLFARAMPCAGSSRAPSLACRPGLRKTSGTMPKPRGFRFPAKRQKRRRYFRPERTGLPVGLHGRLCALLHPPMQAAQGGVRATVSPVRGAICSCIAGKIKNRAPKRIPFRRPVQEILGEQERERKK